MLQATWGERPPQGGCDRVVFQPTAAPELLASVMGGYSVLLWSLGGCEDVPAPLILEPQHSEVRTLPAGNAGRNRWVWTVRSAVPAAAPSSASGGSGWGQLHATPAASAAHS